MLNQEGLSQDPRTLELEEAWSKLGGGAGALTHGLTSH
jgi:hypothetical protein